MSDRISPADLDNYITGHWGEDQYPEDDAHPDDIDPDYEEWAADQMPSPCWVMCTVCHKNPVNAGDGYDTCHQCEQGE